MRRSLNPLSQIRWRSAAWQFLLLVAVVTSVAWVVQTTAGNLASRGIAIGFGFLTRPARFPISQSLLPYDPSDSFGWAFLVGCVNTAFLSGLIVLAATLAGMVVALGRRSHHPLGYGLATGFVEAMRNTPLVVQLLFWYGLLTFGLPEPHAALHLLPDVFLTNRGLHLPWPVLISGPEGAHLVLQVPTLGRFNFTGGLTLTPELTAIVLGLTSYSSAYVGEIIRAGIEAVPRGQWEAGRALGLTERQTLWRIIVPQAMRVIVPPMSSQYINIIKNSTLALVVGYPDLAFVTATTINQTGQALEGVALLMATFLTASLLASWLINRYNRGLMARWQ